MMRFQSMATFLGRNDDLFGHLRQAGAHGHFFNIFRHDSSLLLIM